MHNFVFHNPTKVLFGKNTIPSVGVETLSYGKRTLLVFGKRSAARNGTLSKVRSSLLDAGAEIVEHGSVSPNPTLDHVHEGIRIAKAESIEVICAVGGGSVIDSAKAISAGALVEHDVWKFFTGKKSVRQALPLIAISTLAASGSEMNSGMVLTNTGTSQKFGFAHRLLYPKVSIMDPETTYSVSAEYTALGAIDAFAHLLEFYMTNVQNGTMVQDRYMEGLAKSIIESCNSAQENPFSYEARASLMWAAGLSLNGMASSGLGKVGFPMHLIEHSLSAVYNIPHGAGLSIVIPAWLRFQKENIPDRMNIFFGNVLDIDAADPDCSIRGIDILSSWFRKIGAPTTLQEVGIPADQIPLLAENALPLAKVWRMRDYNQQMIEEILRLSC